MKILLVNPTGNQNSKNLARGLYKKKILQNFITSFNINIKNSYFRYLSKKIKEKMQSRDYSFIKNKAKGASNFKEFSRIILTRLNIKKPNFLSNVQLFDDVDKYSSLSLNNNITHVYCYQNCALNTFIEAKKRGIKCIYELPTIYWKEHNKIIKDEIKKKPHLKKNLLNSHFLIDKKKQKKLDKEISMADLIIAPSSYTQKTLRLFDGKLPKIRVIHYGSQNIYNIKKKNWYDGKRKLNILFVGNFNQNKGISYLIDIVKNLDTKKICLNLIGSGPLKNYILKNLPFAKFYGSVGHKQIISIMRQNDILVFPTLFEGFGLVLSEAMSQGLTVISTKNTFLRDVKEKDAFIISDNKKIKKTSDKIKEIIDNPSMLKKIGKNAINFSKKNSWSRYIDKIIKEVQTC